MDGKGRVSLPARFREVLEDFDRSGGNADRVILTRTFDDCLKLYPIDEWLDFEEKVRELSDFDNSVKQLKRIYVGGAVECELDDHGRLLVPQQLREFADLDREVIWVGTVDTVELWSEENWSETMEMAHEDTEELEQKVAELGL